MERRVNPKGADVFFGPFVMRRTAEIRDIDEHYIV